MRVNTPPTLPEGLREISLGGSGLRGWQVDTPLCRALVSAQGGQLLAFQARGREPLLWLSPAALLVPGKAIRGGIPLCFPWFGPHPADARLPAHGFARLREWRLALARVAPDALHLEFALEADAATRDLWPHDFHAVLRLGLGNSLSLQLEVSNTGNAPFCFSFAFHSYFPLVDSCRARVEGLEGSSGINQLDPARRRRRQQGPVRFDGETDRIFTGVSADCRLQDEARDSAVRLNASDCRSVIVWNPGPEKTAGLADMPAAGWKGMACVESGNVEEDAISLPPGAARTFSLTLTQEP